MERDVAMSKGQAQPAAEGRHRLMGFAIAFSAIAPCLALIAPAPVLPAIQAHFINVPNAAFLTGFLISMMGPAMILG